VNDTKGAHGGAESGLICEEHWTDAEPDTLRIAVQRCRDPFDDAPTFTLPRHGMPTESGPAFITFTCSSTWLPPSVVAAEVIPWLKNCVENARHINGSGEIAADPCLGHQVLVSIPVHVDGVDLEDEQVMDSICEFGLHELGLWGSTNGQVHCDVGVIVHEIVDPAAAARQARIAAVAAAERIGLVFTEATCGIGEIRMEPIPW
jgi:hypothetical protein